MHFKCCGLGSLPTDKKSDKKITSITLTSQVSVEMCFLKEKKGIQVPARIELATFCV